MSHFAGEGQSEDRRLGFDRRVAEGEVFTAENPAGRLHTRYCGVLLGNKARCAIAAGTPLAAYMADIETA